MAGMRVLFSPEFKEHLVQAFLDVESRKTLSQFAGRMVSGRRLCGCG